MPSYLGVKKSEIIRSISDALELLETYSTGPECQKHIDAMRTVDSATGKSPLGAIAAANNDVALARAVSSSGAHMLFGRLEKVLELHAIHNTDGKGEDIVNRLDKWDVRGGARTLEYGPLDAEEQLWCGFEGIRHALPKTPAKEERMQKVFNDLMSRGDEKQAVQIVNTIILLCNSMSSNSEVEVQRDWKNIFGTLDLRERNIALQYIEAMSAPAVPRPVVSPFNRYGIVADESIREELGDKVQKALEPFMELREVQMMGVGAIARKLDENTPWGIMFVSTKRAVQAVADALPDQKVIDQDGGLIPPKTRRQAPKPGFQP
jgi:hypothetical protein